MCPTLQLLLSALALAVVSQASLESQEVIDKHPTCDEFIKGETFNDSHGIGTWYLLHYKTPGIKSLGDSRCILAEGVTDQERKNASERLNKYIDNVNWDKLVLKLEIPCPTEEQASDVRHYYLEKLAEGSFMILRIPDENAKLDQADYHRYPMRLKMVDGQYLGMMECHDKFVFLFGRERLNGTEFDAHFKQVTETYWLWEP